MLHCWVDEQSKGIIVNPQDVFQTRTHGTEERCKHPLRPGSQAPAWELTSTKLRFATRISPDSIGACGDTHSKQSFEKMRSQAGAWERGKNDDSRTVGIIVAGSY